MSTRKSVISEDDYKISKINIIFEYSRAICPCSPSTRFSFGPHGGGSSGRAFMSNRKGAAFIPCKNHVQFYPPTWTELYYWELDQYEVE